MEVEIVLTGAPPLGNRQNPIPLAELEENGPITVWSCIKNWAEGREFARIVVLTLCPKPPFIANRYLRRNLVRWGKNLRMLEAHLR